MTEQANTAALVLLSGGQDSTVCLFWALKKFKRVEAVCFLYGQRHATEIEAAKVIAKKAGVIIRIVDLSLIANLSKNSLTDATIAIDKKRERKKPPNTFVPGRNLFFLSVAAIIAREKDIANIVIGVSQADYSGYPDCRNRFIRSLNATLNLAMEEQFVVHTPLMQLKKAAVWQLADELGVFELVETKTVTCYNGIPGAGCKECPSCELRNKGLTKFKNSKIQKKFIIHNS